MIYVKKATLVLAVVLLALILAPGLLSESVPAIPASSNVLLDGESVAFGAYNIEGSNYFNIDDLIAAI